jgi:hypothetical protein
LDLADDGVVSYCFVLYNCEYCGVLTYLSWALDSIRAAPPEAKIGAIVTRYDKKSRFVIRKSVICFPCMKEMRHQRNKDNEDVRVGYFGADDSAAEVEETVNQLKRQAGIPREEW